LIEKNLSNLTKNWKVSVKLASHYTGGQNALGDARWGNKKIERMDGWNLSFSIMIESDG
jgi:hypothetical protein